MSSPKDEKFPTLADFAELTEPRLADEFRSLLPSHDDTVNAAAEYLRDRSNALTAEELARFVHVAGLRYVAGNTLQGMSRSMLK
jgi:hypothetical protein